MSALIILLLTVAFLYAGLIISLARGWRRLPGFDMDDTVDHEFNTFVSVLIPARDEEGNILNCLNDLLMQDFPATNFEIIVIDDHSSDGTSEIVKTVHKNHQHIRLIDLRDLTGAGEGKAAISLGVAEAKGDLIVTSDADCRFGKNWLSGIVAFYETHQPAMICGPVAFIPAKGFFKKFIQLEFISLVASGAGALGLKKPLMCNGANLAFRREAFLQLKDTYLNTKWASGDDMFLMHGIDKKYGKGAVRFLKSSRAVVRTAAPEGLKEFLRQRIRWGSKTRAYPNTFTALVAAMVFLNALLLLISTVAAIFNPAILAPVLFSWFLKVVSDYLLLHQACTFFRAGHLLWMFIPFQLLHVIYITTVAVWMNVAGIDWKRRKY